MENTNSAKTDEIRTFDCSKETCQRFSSNICTNFLNNELNTHLSSIIDIESSLANKGKKNENKVFQHKCNECFWHSKKSN